METFEYKPEDRDSFEYWALIAIISVMKDKDEFFRTKEQGKVSIDLKINGFDCSFLTLIRRMKQEFDWKVEKKAKELLEEKADEVSEKLFDLSEIINKFMQEEIRKIVPGVD